MEKQQPTIKFSEFLIVWVKCVSVMDTLIMEDGYEALTVKNICQRSGLPESAIDTYFGGLEVLLKMHDGVILLDQAYKMRIGNEKLE